MHAFSALRPNVREFTRDGFTSAALSPTCLASLPVLLCRTAGVHPLGTLFQKDTLPMGGCLPVKVTACWAGNLGLQHLTFNLTARELCWPFLSHRNTEAA